MLAGLAPLIAAALSSAQDLNGYARSWTPFVLMLALLLAAGALLWVAMLCWTTWIIHRPPRMTPGRALARLGRAAPADVGLAGEEIVFNLSDAARPGAVIQLAAWWIPHPAAGSVQRTCIMLHGYGDSRAGALAWAPLWQKLGFHLLLLDIRAHGESGGRLSSGGVWERADLHGVIDQLRQMRPMQARILVLFGVSFGGLIAAACAAQRSDLAALVIDSPVDGWASATRRYAQLLGLPLQQMHHWRLRLAQHALGVSFDEVRPVATLPGVSCPTLAILPREDVLVSAQEREAMSRTAEAASERSRVWRTASSHNMAIAEEAEEYERVLDTFLSAALRSTESRVA